MSLNKPPIGGQKIPGKGRKKIKIPSRNKIFGLDIEKDLEVTGYSKPGKFTPEINPNYVFPVEQTRILLLGLEFKDRVLLTGHTGVGKTSLVEQVGARLNYNVVKINFDGCLTRSDLIGEWVVKDKQMEFQMGVLPLAMQLPGTIILLDEWDTQNEDLSFVVHRLLQKDDGKILLLETGGELIDLHPENTVFATANTIGQGDSTGLYAQGTRIQNYAQLNRFNLTIRLDYLDKYHEKKIIKEKFNSLIEVENEAFVNSMNKIRDGFENGEISVPLSIRDTLNWIEKYLAIGNVIKSAQYCFLNRMNKEDAYVCSGIIKRIFEGER